MRRDAPVYIAGHRGLVGSAVLRALTADGYTNLITRTHAELDLTEQQAVREFFAEQRPECVFLAAARVGGIWANSTYPAEFIHQNLAIQTNVIHEAWRAGVKRLLFLGSSCIYPRECPQPMREEYLLTGPLEPTNRPYAVAKIAGIEMCWSYNRQYGTQFLAVMPTNLYGPGDSFDLETSHVLPALIRKFHLAKLAMRRDWEAIAQDEQCWGPIPEDLRAALGMPGSPSKTKVMLWGTGTPRREFLHVDDMADACIFLMNVSETDFEGVLGSDTSGLDAASLPPLVNIGAGIDLPIAELAQTVADTVGYEGRVQWDQTKPDGTPRKLLDVSRLRGIGWEPDIPLADGIRATYGWFQAKSDD